MLVLATIAQLQESKFASVRAFMCDGYDDNAVAYIAYRMFLWSKYVEWGDTLFLHLSGNFGGKPITMLQYTHHMSTALLTYVAVARTTLSPAALAFLGTNTIVHVPMYWHFAFPCGVLQPYRRRITQSQIVQHIVCLGVIVYTSCVDDCTQAEYVNSLGLALYSMYLGYFAQFYGRMERSASSCE